MFGEIGPYPPVRKRTVGGNVECGEAQREGFGHDERAAVGGEHHAIGEDELVSGHML
ncbi:unannotated protein [freshwater metagenome]|uniref:Unannotated protein n=1 Tax=freshwater metagenome TaxID=449393 RepID=A0A6J5YKP4_9ZZZZ